MDASVDHLQDKLRKERTNAQLILTKCNFDIVEKNVDSSSGEEERGDSGSWSSRVSANNVTDAKRGISFPVALHRSKLNLQKDNQQERLDLRRIYENNISRTNYVNTKMDCIAEMGNVGNSNGRNAQAYGDNDEIRGLREDKNEKKETQNVMCNVEKRYNVTYLLNKNELAKLQWTNPVNDDEIREIKNVKDIKLHEIRFDFAGKWRIQINEILFNEKKKKKIFNNFDGLYHHNAEPLNSGYTIPEILFLCQSSYNNQVCIALKILKNVFINFRLKVVTPSTIHRDILNYEEPKNKYSYGFTYKRFSNYLNNDLSVFEKLTYVLNYYSNKNVQISCLHALASYVFPNNVCTLPGSVIFGQAQLEEEKKKEEEAIEECENTELIYFYDYEPLSYYDFFSDSIFLFENYNIYFFSCKKKIMNSTGEEEKYHMQQNIKDSDLAEDKYANLSGEKPNDLSNFINKYKENEPFVKNKKYDGMAYGSGAERMNKSVGRGKNVLFRDKQLLSLLEHMDEAEDDPLKKQNVNFKAINWCKTKGDKYCNILGNISNMLLSNFGVVEIENSCVCLLIGLLATYRQEINILHCKELVQNLERIYESKIWGSELCNERMKRGNAKGDANGDANGDAKTNENVNLVDLNFTHNLITLVRYILVYNYENNILKKFDVLSFLIFYRSLPFNRKKKNNEMYLFLACETVSIFRLLLHCNLYIESVDYFHDLINDIHRVDIKNSTIYKKFLTQTYLYIATYNVMCIHVDLSGFLYITKVMKTLEIQMSNVFNVYTDEYSEEKNKFSRGDQETVTLPVQAKKKDSKKKKNFNFFCDLALLQQCCNYLYTVFLSIRKKYITKEQFVSDDQIVEITKLITKLANIITKEFDEFLDIYKDEGNDIISSIISKIKDCPFPFSYAIYKYDMDDYFFFVIYIQIVNTILNIIFEVYATHNREEKNFTISIQNVLTVFEQGSLKYFQKNIFEAENVLDSYNIFLPLSYLFYNLYKIDSMMGDANVSTFRSATGKEEERLFLSLHFCSSVSLSYYCLKEILNQKNGFNSWKKSGHNIFTENNEHFWKNSPKGDTKNNTSDEQFCHILRDDNGDTGGVKNNSVIARTEMSYRDYDTPGNAATYVLLFLWKYLQGNPLTYHSKKNIFLLLLKNIFKECSKPKEKAKGWEDDQCEEKKEREENGEDDNFDETLISQVLGFLLNNNMVSFLSKHMDVCTFLKFFIYLFLFNQNKRIGDYLSEQVDIYTDLMTIAKVYIFQRVICLDVGEMENNHTSEEEIWVKNIENIVDDFLKNEVVGKKKEDPLLYEHFMNIFEKNKRNIKIFVRQKKLKISKNISQIICEKMIESFKLGYFFNPLFIAVLFFLSSVSFPQESRCIFFGDKNLLKLLSRNVFIYFYDKENYVIFTISTYYGKKEFNYLVDLTPFFPSIFSFLVDASDDIKLDHAWGEYFKSLQSEYAYPSLLHFLFYAKEKLSLCMGEKTQKAVNNTCEGCEN
ncbi:RNA polymerase II-associated protein 1, putative [Plasmodium ovale wallikeri]|uniref:RNA polymerase II-associated protein 1, putative n=1 Tax=Plasmodium ovale wallikeri TaxID=864142 RepID=A0A1A8YPF3_PLAOA|nr:RNA polymerase II-associated protein 1, putative [Plasmodium ovale wallikeri]